MKIEQIVTRIAQSLFGTVVVLAGMGPSVLADDNTGHFEDRGVHASMPLDSGAADRKDQLNDLVRIVRDATERFRDVRVAEAEGYTLQFGCVSGSDAGAMGLHFVNGALVGDGEIVATQPEIVIYEPSADGRLRLIGADYLVLADAWHSKHAAPPELMGQLFHLFDSPNRFGLPAFYTLHVWAWKDNPNGTFVNWHPQVSCDGFKGQNP